ncbi:MAG TPA: hypothetical protein VKT77_11980, partial [Chthonomonadaceae bacterium]|nr:hypothetical protein [Chthonomonadaceae bacterium]
MPTVHGLCLAALFAVGVPAVCAAQARDSQPEPLPVRQVTLFSSGVSYVERRGALDGDATVPLTFRVGQINDILKSMVLLDSSGSVQPATYTARDPIGRTLQSFAVDVSGDTTFQQILTQLRGARVTVEAPNVPQVTGRIVSVEEKEVARADGKPVTALFLNVLTEPAEGKDSALVALRLDGERQVRFLDERINREFQSALGLLATGADDQRRTVTLHFAGNGRREVRVGYVVEAPIWKMSYRLLVGGTAPGQAAGRPYLQGWAMVENTSDEDWKEIKLSLVSGRPVSFIEDLCQPLYLHRPEVAPDVIASTMPQTHDGDLGTFVTPLRKANAEDASRALSQAFGTVDGSAKSPFSGLVGGNGANQNSTNGRQQSRAAGGFGGGRPEPGGARPAGERGEPGPADAPAPPQKPAEIAELLRRSVVAQAAGEKAGALFQYNVSAPITLPRQQAALIPVVARDVEADKVLLFNADAGQRFALDAVRVHNVTGLHLKGGPVTLFEDGVYAGDARMEDIPPGDTRLLSYAVDLTVECERQATAGSNTETTFTLRRGVLQVSIRSRIETTYSIKSKADKPRTVL